MRRIRIASEPNGIRADEQGYILIFSLFMLLILTLIGVSLVVVGINEFGLAARTRLMDQAYSIAETGVNRATVQLKTQPDLLTETAAPENIYRSTLPGTLPQWPLVMDHWENFADGQFKAQIWQSNILPDDPTAKVIISTGRITKGGRTAERTIETRIIVPKSSDPNQAAYEDWSGFLIYVGCKEARSSTGQSPNPWKSGSIGINMGGSWTFNASTAGASGVKPKGILYTRGPAWLAVHEDASLILNGNVISTDALLLGSSNDPSTPEKGAGELKLTNGHFIAGIDPSVPNPHYPFDGWDKPDGTGTAHLELAEGDIFIGTFWTADDDHDPILLGTDCYLAAKNNVQVGALLGGGSVATPLNIQGGIVAGGNVNVTGIGSAGKPVALTNVFAGGKVDINQLFAKAMFNVINCGKDSTGLGVQLTGNLAGSIVGGSIWTSGKLDVNSLLSKITVITKVKAGSEGSNPSIPSGVGVDISTASVAGAGFEVTGAEGIECQGSAIVDAKGALGLTVPKIHAGINVSDGVGIDLKTAAGLGGTIGDLSAVGDIKVDYTGASSILGDIKSDGNIYMSIAPSVVCTVGDIDAGGSILNYSGAKPAFSGSLGLGVGRLKAGKDIGSAADRLIISSSLPTIGGTDGVMAGGYINPTDGSLYPGSIYLSVTSAIGNVNNRTMARGAVDIWSHAAAGGMTFHGIWGGGNVSLSAKGNDGNPANGPSIYTGLMATTPIKEGVWSGGQVALEADQGTLLIGSDGFNIGYVRSLGGLNPANPTPSNGGTIYMSKPEYIGSVGIPPVSAPPVVGLPDLPAYDAIVFPPVGDTFADIDVLSFFQNTPPLIGSGDGSNMQNVLLDLAGVQEPVELTEPNWDYFYGAALEQDRIIRDDPAFGPAQADAQPHILKDNGNPANGDYFDENGNTPGVPGDGVIGLRWDYWVDRQPGENEILCNTDDADIVLFAMDFNVDWQLNATLVNAGLDLDGDGKGGDIILKLEGGTAEQGLQMNQTLNLIARRDILARGGLQHLYGDSQEAFVHFYAGHDLDLSNCTLAAAGTGTFKGSIAAGNYVTFDAYTFGTETGIVGVATHEQWPLNVQAFAPRVRILTWQEK